MKKSWGKCIFIIILMVFVGSTAVFAVPKATPVINNLTTAEANKKMNDSANDMKKVVGNIKTNFKSDTDFTRMIDFLYIRHLQFRLQVKNAIFPNLYEFKDSEYKKMYYTVTADFVVSQDKKFIESYKDLITPFCKYSVKYKNSSACSPDTINSLFETD